MHLFFPSQYIKVIIGVINVLLFYSQFMQSSHLIIKSIQDLQLEPVPQLLFSFPTMHGPFFGTVVCRCMWCTILRMHLQNECGFSFSLQGQNGKTLYKLFRIKVVLLVLAYLGGQWMQSAALSIGLSLSYEAFQMFKRRNVMKCHSKVTSLFTLLFLPSFIPKRRMNQKKKKKKAQPQPSVAILSLLKWPKRETQKNPQDPFGDYKCDPIYFVRQLDLVSEVEKDSALALLELRDILFILLNGLR